MANDRSQLPAPGVQHFGESLKPEQELRRPHIQPQSRWGEPSGNAVFNPSHARLECGDRAMTTRMRPFQEFNGAAPLDAGTETRGDDRPKVSGTDGANVAQGTSPG